MSVTEYTSRMNKVLDYIDANLDQPLNLAVLKGQARIPF